jgi:site-specific DNA-methyltransferase (adenine-specific)
MGSGTCAIACIDAGLDFTGCEIDAEYYKKLTARIKDYIKQGNLFEETELREERGNNEEKL